MYLYNFISCGNWPISKIKNDFFVFENFNLKVLKNTGVELVLKTSDLGPCVPNTLN